ncbi:hypothetical protein E2C01_083711 [Portunus trituberculatus]|uniref:Uncharacterized protein n=1 Tax=Portunus trituberculatus TaxID=210409 RepID=A0A5B7IVW2_PORTR|nr:hypothetical protein [Portunus trituberculatus]
MASDKKAVHVQAPSLALCHNASRRRKRLYCPTLIFTSLRGLKKTPVDNRCRKIIVFSPTVKKEKST